MSGGSVLVSSTTTLTQFCSCNEEFGWLNEIDFDHFLRNKSEIIVGCFFARKRKGEESNRYILYRCLRLDVREKLGLSNSREVDFTSCVIRC